MADQVPEERQYALILVAGGDEAYNSWDTLEEIVEDPKKVDQVWDAFEKSFEQFGCDSQLVVNDNFFLGMCARKYIKSLL